jgi:hypothetical protein
VGAGGALAAWVWWRSGAGVVAASHAWLAGAIVGFAVTFLRVPTQVYWRADAALLAQLPIEGRPLFDAALVRCVRAAAATTIAVAIALVPLALGAEGGALAARHAVFAGALGVAAALLIPAVTIGAAAMVVHGTGERALRAAAALAGAAPRTAARSTAHVGVGAGAGSKPAGASTAVETTARSPAGSSASGTSASGSSGSGSASPAAILGALPGFAATIVIAAALVVRPWLVGVASDGPAPIVLGAISAVSLAAAIAARRGAGIMGRILRDVSALDRQRLATLEVRPPTPIERAIARLIGDAALPYGKDARLMRRRFPMAFALGALVLGVLVIVGLVRPDDPTPWLMVAIGSAASYGIVLAGRLHRAPIELRRLSATLPLSASSLARAKLAWLLGWWVIFAAAPAVFAALRQSQPGIGLALAAVATIVVIVAGASPR